MANIILNPDDLPTAEQLRDATSRLRKCYRLLQRIRGTDDKEDPESLKATADFLEMMIKREKRNLPQTPRTLSDGMEILIDMVASHLLEMDEWERKQTIEETKLKRVFGEQQNL